MFYFLPNQQHQVEITGADVSWNPEGDIYSWAPFIPFRVFTSCGVPHRVPFCLSSCHPGFLAALGFGNEQPQYSLPPHYSHGPARIAASFSSLLDVAIKESTCSLLDTGMLLAGSVTYLGIQYKKKSVSSMYWIYFTFLLIFLLSLYLIIFCLFSQKYWNSLPRVWLISLSLQSIKQRSEDLVKLY